MTNRLNTLLLLAVFAIAGCASAPEAPEPAPQPKEQAPAPAPAPAPARAPAPAPAPPKPGTEKVTMATETLFDFDKAIVKPDGKIKLDDLVGKLRGVSLEVVIAVGHADRIGSDAYNMKLSVRRADSVKAYLVSKGIPANRIYTEGKGKRQPVTRPDQCKGPKSQKVIACLQPDRRVEIEVVGTRPK